MKNFVVRLLFLLIYKPWFLKSQECQYPLGMENYDIEDYQLSAFEPLVQSTKFSPAWNARINNENYFQANEIDREGTKLTFKSVPGNWFQLDLLVPHVFTGMLIQGSYKSNNMITTWKLKFSNDMETWNWYSDMSGNAKLLPEDGPYNTWSYTNPSTAMYINITSIQARGFRFYPQSATSVPGVRMEVYGCTLGPDYYTKYTDNITTTVDVNKSVMEINTNKTYAITSVLVNITEVDMSNFNLSSSVSIYYMKPAINQTWRQVSLSNHSIVIDEIEVSLALAVKATKLKIECDVKILKCTSFVALYGRQLGSCPVTFVQFNNHCYKHVPYQVAMKTDRDRSICKRMSWSDGVNIAVPESLSELHFLKILDKRSGSQVGSHIGMFRSDSSSPWLDQRSETVNEPYFWGATSTYNCAKLQNLVAPNLCTDALPFTCKVKAEGTSEHDGCEWSLKSNVKLSNNNKKVISGVELTECMWHCQMEQSFKCSSVEWKYSNNQCMLNTVNSHTTGVSIVSESYTDLYEYICFQEPECLQPLLFRNGVKENVTFSASSTATSLDNIKLDKVDYPSNGNYWYPSSATHPYFQVEFNNIAMVQKLIMMGGTYSASYYVTKFFLLYTNNTDMWTFRLDGSGLMREYDGPADAYSQAQHMFDPALIAKFYRIEIRSYSGSPAMRMELYGCVINEHVAETYSPYNSLGMDSFSQMDIENYQLSAQYRKGYPNVYYPPFQARWKNDPDVVLGKQKPYWAGNAVQNQWFQVDFLTPHNIVGLAMNGGSSTDLRYYTTKFKIQYSTSSPLNLDSVRDSIGNEQIFPGQFKYDVGIYTSLLNYTIKARFFRIVITEYYGSPYQRYEFYGEPSLEDCPTLNESHVDVITPNIQCSCNIQPSPDYFSACTNNENKTVTINFRSLFFIHGIEILFDPVWQHNLTGINISYFHPGNASWSLFWHQRIQNNSLENGKYLFHAQRMCRALKMKIEIPVSENGSFCFRLNVYGFKAPACPPGFVHHRNQCYQIPEGVIQMWDSSTNNFNWQQINMCQKMTWNGTANLGTLMETEEMDFVYKLASRLISSSGLYIGYIAHNLSVEPYQFSWLDANPSTWVNWAPSQPTGGKIPVPERCTAIGIGYDFRYFDVPCSDYLAYLCKVDAIKSTYKETSSTPKSLREWSVMRDKRSNIYDKINERVEIKDHNISQCISLCESGLVWPNCTSVDFYAAGKSCYLSTANERSNTFIAATGYDFYYVNILEEDCMSALVWPNYPGQVSVSASSRYAHNRDVRYADINDVVNHWTPSDTNSATKQYIQVDFHAIAKIVKFTMTGSFVSNCYVTYYHLLYTNDTRWWQYYDDENGEHLKFVGNNKAIDIKRTYFNPPIYSRFIRIEPYSAYSLICMKFEFYGCITATDHRQDCTAILRGSSQLDTRQFSYIEFNGHPYVRYQTYGRTGYTAIQLATMDPELCQADLISVHSLGSDTTNQNTKFRERISSFPAGTVLYGVTSYDGETTDATTNNFLKSLGLQELGVSLGSNYNRGHAFMIIIGETNATNLVITDPRYGPAMIVKSVNSPKCHGYFDNTEIPRRLAHWPFNLNDHYEDISGNNFHLNVHGSGITIQRDKGTFDHFYADFSASGYLRIALNNSLHLKQDFTIFYAVKQNSDGTFLAFHDSVLSGYSSFFSIKFYSSGFGLQIQRSSSDIVMNSNYKVDASVWTFLAFTFNNETKRLRAWKNGIVMDDKVVSGDFSLSTDKSYLTVGYDGGFFTGKLACLQIFNQSLKALQIQKLIFECRGKKDIYKDIKDDITNFKPLDRPLGMMDGFISESQTKVSSTTASGVVTYYSFHKDNLRLYSNSKSSTDSGCWMPKTTSVNEWIQIDLAVVHQVSGLVMKGCPCISGYVTHVLVEYSVSSNWTVLLPENNINNKTVSASKNWDLAIKSMFPEIILARYLRLWIHTTSSYSPASLEILGSPVDLPQLTSDELDKMTIIASSFNLKTQLMYDVSSSIPCEICKHSTNDVWWALDLGYLFYITNIVLMHNNASITHEYDFKFQKRFLGREWEDLTEKPYLKRQLNGSLLSYTYLFAPVLRTRYLKIYMLIDNTTCHTCIRFVVHGQRTPVCPDGSFLNPVNKKCIYYYYADNTPEKYKKSSTEIACQKFNWITPGRVIITHQPKLGQFASYLYNRHCGHIGMSHDGNAQTAFWIDGTSAHPVPWLSTVNSVPIPYIYSVSASYGNTYMNNVCNFMCETNSSEYVPPQKMTITAIKTFKLFVDGLFKGERKWWDYPWIFSFDQQPKVVAVEMTATSTDNPGLLAQLSDGTMSDSSWKCTDKWEPLWAEVSFDDNHWANATEIESLAESTKTLKYGFKENTNNTFWIWTKNHSQPKDTHVYCRKNFPLLMENIENENNYCTWVYWEQFCPSIPYATELVASSLAECVQKCQANTSIQCRAVDYYKSTKKCYLRTDETSNIQTENYVANSDCYQLHMWCSVCQRNLLMDMYHQGLVSITASSSSYAPTNGILNNYNLDKLSFEWWYTTTRNVHQWLKAEFTYYVNMTAIKIQTFQYRVHWFHVYYVHPNNNTNVVIRSWNRERQKFYTNRISYNLHATNVLKEPIITKSLLLNPQSYNTYITLSFDVTGCVLKDYIPPTNTATLDDDWHLGMANHHIGLTQITASSFTSNYYPVYGRFSTSAFPNSKCWKPSSYSNPYLQVDLLISHYISAVYYQSCPGVSHYVITISLRYSSDAVTWNQIYKQDGVTEAVYDGGSYFNGDSIGHVLLENSVKARHVRVVVKTYSSSVGLRMELVGKPADCSALYTSSLQSLTGTSGMKDHEIRQVVPQTNSSLQSSWCPNKSNLSNSKPEIVIELNAMHHVTSVDFINSSNVVALKFEYSNDGQKWKTYYDERIKLEVINIQGRSKLRFPQAIRLKILKITLEDWNSQPCLQVLIHGCVADACPVNSIQQNDTCYYHNKDMTLRYDDISYICKDYNWFGNGYPMMPKNWKKFNFMQAITTPAYSYKVRYAFIGLARHNGYFTWADNDNITGLASLPFTPNSYNCVRIGHVFEQFTSASCTSSYDVFCEVKSSVSQNNPREMWMNRWDVSVSGANSLQVLQTAFLCMRACQTSTSFDCKYTSFRDQYNHCYMGSDPDFGILSVSASSTYHYFERYVVEPCETNILDGLNFNISVNVSSYYDINHGPEQVIYDPSFSSSATTYWRPADSDVERWIQFDFGGYFLVKRIFYTGAHEFSYWTYTIRASFSIDGQWFQHYDLNPKSSSSGETLVTKAPSLNSKRDADVALKYPFIARYLKVTILSYSGKPALRLAIYGCHKEKDDLPKCYNAIGMNSGAIKPSQLSSSSVYVNSAGSWNSHLNGGTDSVDNANDLAGWIPYPVTDTSSFIQVDLFGLYNITHIITQGIGSSYVKAFNIEYSTDRFTWISKRKDGSIMTYPGTLDKVIQPLAPSIETSSIRIFPKSYSSRVALRFELVGCSSDCPTLSTDRTSSSGWKYIEPCLWNSSLMCSKWCSNDNGDVEIRISFAENYRLTGFILRKNHTSVNNYDVGITNTSIIVTGLNSERKNMQVIKIYDYNNVTGDFWKWKLLEASIVSSMEMNIPNINNSHCVELEVLACPVTACPVGFVQYGVSCYYFRDILYNSPYQYKGLSYDSTEKICKDMSWGTDGKIALPSDTITNYFLQHLALPTTGDMFLRASYSNVSNTFMSSNETIKYTHWDGTNGHPNPSIGNCITLSNGFWKSTSCDLGKTVCQTKTTGSLLIEWIFTNNVQVQGISAFKTATKIRYMSFCLQICENTEFCKSVQYDVAQMECLLFKQTRYDPALTLASGTKTYSEKNTLGSCTLPLLTVFAHQISSSSDLDTKHSKNMVIMDQSKVDISGGFWQPASNVANEWIKITFTFALKLAKLVVIGTDYLGTLSQVTKFKFSYSPNSQKWIYAKNEIDNTEVFTSLTAYHGLTQFLFSTPLFATQFKVEPQAWSNNIAMQIKMFGCAELVEVYDCGTLLAPSSLKCYKNWNVILEHKAGETDFIANWNIYKNGFQSISGEYYIGNTKLHALTDIVLYDLRIDMWKNAEEFIYAEFNGFQLLSELKQYEVNIGEFIGGTAGEGGLLSHSGAKFYTKDVANYSCANESFAGFWYLNSGNIDNSTKNNGCYESLLTGYPTISWKNITTNETDSISKLIMRIQAKIDSINIALKRTTYMSSTSLKGYVSSKAVDGYRLYDPVKHSCAVTQIQDDPYWIVDLGKEFQITTVTISTSSDVTLQGFDLKVSKVEPLPLSPDLSKYTLCQHYSGIVPVETTLSLKCANILGRFVAIQAKGKNKVLQLCEVEVYTTFSVKRGLDEECTWDADCSVSFSQCIPKNPSVMTTQFHCLCQQNYQASNGMCKPVVDLYLNTTFDEQVILRGVPGNFTFDIDIVNKDTRDVWPVPSSDINYNITLKLTDTNITQSPAGYELNFLTSSHSFATLGVNGSSTISFQVNYKIYLTPEECSHIKYICMELTTPTSASYYKNNSTDNIICAHSAKIVLCRPDIDLLIKSAEYNNDSLILRNVTGPYTFNISLSSSPGSYAVVDPGGTNINFVVKYILLPEQIFNGNSHVNDSKLLPTTIALKDAQKFIATPNTINFVVYGLVDMDFATCNASKYICLLLFHHPTATYLEKDFSNNVYCIDIDIHKECRPKLPIFVMILAMLHSSFVRGYNVSTNMTIELYNNHRQIPVSQLSDLSYNYNITMFAADRDMAQVNSGRTLVYLVDVPRSQLQAEIQPKGTLFMDGMTTILIPRKDCDLFKYFCIEVSPAITGSYQLFPGQNTHHKCISAVGMINCLGVKMGNVTFTHQPKVSAVSDAVSFSVAWAEGTDTNFVIDFGDNSPLYQWNWQNASHIQSFGAFENSASYIYDEIGNYTAKLKIWNQVQEETYHNNIIIQPYLMNYINFSVIYTPGAVPVTVAVKMYHMKPYLNVPFWITCTAQYEVDNQTSSFQISDTHSLLHTFIVDVPERNISVLCKNDISNVSYNSFVILRENITGLTIFPEKNAYPTKNKSIFYITMETGSHVVLAIDFGDQSSEYNLSDNNTHSSNFTWKVDHVYLANGNYTVTVHASNKYFSESNQTKIIIQNPVPVIKVDALSSIKYPDGIVNFRLQPLNKSLLPDNVFCQWKFDNFTQILEYSVSLMKGVEEQKQYTYDRRHIGYPVLVEVECFNLVSTQRTSITIRVFEETRNLIVINRVGHYNTFETVTYELAVTNGSNVMFGIDYGDGTEEIVYHPNIFAFSSNVFIHHNYSSVGNYSVIVNATNPVSYAVSQGQVIIIQNQIQNLTLFTNASVIWPPGIVTFVIGVGYNQKVLTNIFCRWKYRNSVIEKSYFDRIDSLNPVSHSIEFPKSFIGTVNMTVNCNNLISQTNVTAQFIIIFDEIIFENLLTEDWIWWTNTSTFNLTLKRFATHSCFEWDMGDGNVYLYGVPWCQSSANSKGYNLKPIVHGTLFMQSSHIYKTWGSYKVSVFAYNHVSNNTISLTAVVKDWYCYSPNITYANSFTNPNNPAQLRKGYDFQIGVNVSIDCMKSLNRSESYIHIYNGSKAIGSPVLKQFNVTTLNYKRRSLAYGMYNAILKVIMLNIPDKFTESQIYFEITKTPLDVNIPGDYNVSINLMTQVNLDAQNASFDHDIDPRVPQGLTFEWSCRQLNEELPIDSNSKILDAGSPDPSITSFSMFKGCFGGGPGKLPEKSGSLIFNTGDMMPNKGYIFRVSATKDTRKSFAEKVIYVTPAPAPKVNLVCRDNCGLMRRLSTSMFITAYCTNFCETKFGNIKYFWELEAKNSSTGKIYKYDNLEIITKTGVNTKNLYTEAWSLFGGMAHTATLSVWTPGSVKGIIKYNFLSNKPPYGGSCSISPLEGYSSKTLYEFACFNWKEFPGPGKKNQLKYEYRVKSFGDTRSFLVYFGNKPLSDPSFLPVGNYTQNFLNEMELYIVDTIGDYYKLTQLVTTNHPLVAKSVIAAQLMDDINNKSSKLQQAIANKNYKLQSSIVFASASLLNVPADLKVINETEDLNTLLQQRKEIRSSLINMMADTPVESVDGLVQTNDVVRSLVLQAREVNIDSQLVAGTKLDELTNFFINSKGNVTNDKKKQISTDLGSSSVRVMIAGDSSLTEAASINDSISIQTNVTNGNFSGNNLTGYDIASRKVGEVMKKAVVVMTKITGTLAEDKEVGDPQDTIDLGEVALIVDKSTGSQINNTQFGSKHGNILLPDIAELLPDSNGDCISSELMFTSINPFIWDTSSKEVNSNVASFQLLDCSNKAVGRIRRNVNTAASFEVELGVSNPAPAIFVNHTDGIITHILNLTTNPKPVTISVYPIGNESLRVLIGFNRKPDATYSEDYFEVPKLNSSQADDSAFTYYIDSDNLTASNVTQLFIGVKRNGCLQDTECQLSSNISYRYRMSEMKCQVWDSIREKWTSDGCQVQPGSTPTKVRFKSNLFGSMGAGVFVGPNTIDFSSVFDNFGQKLADNAAVVGTVISVIVLYVVAIIFCRRLDKRDMRKWMILPLVDNDPLDKNMYELHIYTGLLNNAGTDSKIQMILAGTKTDTGIRLLHDGERKNFQRGDVTSFLMRTTFSLGVPVTLKIWHNNSGEGKKAGWYLSKVVVVDLKKNKWYLFMCEDWLSAEESDGSIERILKLASLDDMADNGSALLQNNIKKKLFDDHIWLSVGYRSVRSSFTRVQRLSCCVAILFLTMVTNAMWYGTGSTESSQAAFTIGPISFTVHQLYTSVMSSLIVVPPVLVITVLFSKSRQKQRKLDNSDDNVNEAKGALEREEQRSTATKKIPYWCIYIAYILVFLSVASGAFFTILYAFQWGKEKSTAWLVTFLLSFIQSLLLVQPIKVIIVAALLTFLFKKDSDTSDYEDIYGKMENRNDDLQPANKEILSSTMQLTQEEIELAQKRKLLKEKLNAMIKEIVWNILFLALLLYVVVGNQNNNVYLQNMDMKKTFTSNILEISSKDKLWGWLHSTLLPALYFNQHSNLKPVEKYDTRFINNMYSMRLGPPILRQLRVNQENCQAPKPMETIVRKCNRKFSPENMQRGNYTREWKTLLRSNESANVIGNDKAFLYTSQIDGIMYWGNLAWYPSGGYIVNLGDEYIKAQETLNHLNKYNWIDQFTRVILVEFSVWNANTNLFNMFMLSFEIFDFGGVVTWINLDSINLYRYSGPGGLLNLLAEILLTLFVVVLIIKDIIKALKSRGQTCKCFWNIVTVLSYVLYFTAFGLYVWRSLLTVQKVEEMMNNKGKAVNFQLLVLANTLFMNFLSIMTFLIIMRLIHILRYNKTILVLGTTLQQSVKDLSGTFVTFGITFCAFTVLCFIVFHSHLSEYRSIPSTMSTLLTAFLGVFNFAGIVQATGLFGAVILLVYLLIMMLFMMNIFIALLNEFLNSVQNHPESLPKEYEVAEYLANLFKTAFSKQDKATSKAKTQEVEEFKSQVNSCNDKSYIPTAVEKLIQDFVSWKQSRKINYKDRGILHEEDSSEDERIESVQGIVDVALHKLEFDFGNENYKTPRQDHYN